MSSSAEMDRSLQQQIRAQYLLSQVGLTTESVARARRELARLRCRFAEIAEAIDTARGAVDRQMTIVSACDAEALRAFQEYRKQMLGEDE